jgi:hypothetical protein
MRLPRMTIRRWMVVVAVVGLLIGGYCLERREDEFLERAAFYRRLARHDIHARPHGNAYHRAMIDYSHAMDRKYEDAAKWPWLRVEPDPPAPE